MSLADIYREQFGEQTKEAEANVEANVEGELSKEAADQAVAEAIESLTEEEAEKIAQVIEVFEDEKMEFEHDLQKLAAAAEIVDEYDEAVAVEESEKVAAEEIDAGGRLFARAMVDELQNMEE